MMAGEDLPSAPKMPMGWDELEDQLPFLKPVAAVTRRANPLSRRPGSPGSRKGRSTRRSHSMWSRPGLPQSKMSDNGPLL